MIVLIYDHRIKRKWPLFDQIVVEQNIDGKWIKKQILDSLKSFKKGDFRVRAIVSDNHSANVLPYKLLLMELDHLNDDLEYDYRKFCLLHDTLHLIKNVKNNS